MTMRAGCRFCGILTSAAVLLVACVALPSSERATNGTAPDQQGTPDGGQVQGTESTQAPKAEFVATEELKRKTFDEVQNVIDALERIIAAGDYDQWLSYLTGDYTRSRSSAAFLAEASKAPVLKRDGIVLMTLKDYFANVVVRSHMEAALDDITFVDETHVKAYTRVQGTSAILYYLVREDGRWKIGVRPSGENGAGRTGE